ENDSPGVKETIRFSSPPDNRMTSAEEEVEEWKSLYTDTFGFRHPLHHPAHGVFRFQPVAKKGPQKYSNPWKESYEQLSRGVHVLNSLEQFIGAAEFQCFDHIEEALRFLEESPEGHEKLIFLHEGTHEVTHTIRIASDVQILGASGSEDVASTVIITGKHATVLEFSEGASQAYLGHVTVKYEVDREEEVMDVEEDAQNVRGGEEEEEDGVEENEGLNAIGDPPRSGNHSCAMIITGRGVEPSVEHCHFLSDNVDSHTVVVKDWAAPKVVVAATLPGGPTQMNIRNILVDLFRNNISDRLTRSPGNAQQTSQQQAQSNQSAPSDGHQSQPAAEEEPRVAAGGDPGATRADGDQPAPTLEDFIGNMFRVSFGKL
uniref:Uncharacterized protein n=1 Tax=Caenorhabditis japonica TaxID=281687 RepID=A0A8R1HV37_CAEJA